MKFEDQHDPDPIRRKFLDIESIADIPQEMQNRIGVQYENLLKNLELLAQTSAEQTGDDSYKTDTDAIARYMALMQTQIGDLQVETKKVWHSIIELTAVVHDLIEKLED